MFASMQEELFAAIKNGDLHAIKAAASVLEMYPGEGSLLHIAAAAGQDDVVQYFVDELEMSVFSIGAGGYHPLHVAVANGHASTARLLLRRDACINAIDAEGNSPLHVAVDVANIEMLLLLLQEKSDVHLKNNAKKNALELSMDLMNDSQTQNLNTSALDDAVVGKPSLLKRIEITLTILKFMVDGISNEDGIKHSLNQDAKFQPGIKSNKNIFSSDKADYADVDLSPIWQATKNGNLSEVNCLIDQVLDDVDGNGSTLLHWAVVSGNAEVVKVILEKAIALLDIPNDDGLTPLMLAIALDNAVIVTCLLDKGANILAKNTDGLTALMFSSNVAFLETIEKCLGYSFNVNEMSDYGWTALHEAALNGRIDVVKFLLNKEAKYDITLIKQVIKFACDDSPVVNDSDVFSKVTARRNRDRDIARINGDYARVVVALSHKMVIRDISIAGVYLHEKRAEILVSSKMEDSGCDSKRRTIDSIIAAFEEAVKKRIPASPLMAGMVSGMQVDLGKITVGSAEEIDEYGNTPLHWAAHLGNLEVLEFLLSVGTDSINLKNMAGETPLYLVAMRCCEGAHAARALLEAGADPTIANLDGFTPLHMAGEVEIALAIIVKLKEKGMFNVDILDGSESFSPLFVQTVNWRPEVVALLLAEGANPDLVVPGGKNGTVLHEIIKRLISDGNADIEAYRETLQVLFFSMKVETLYVKDAEERTASDLMMSMCFDSDIGELRELFNMFYQQAILKLPLISLIANKKSGALQMITSETMMERDTRGNTPLHLASLHANQPLLTTIITQYSGLFGAKNDDGMTALDIAMKEDNHEVVRALLEAGANAGVIDNTCNVTLHYASSVICAKIVVEILKKEGSLDLEVCNKEGHTPLDLAVINGNLSLVSFFIRVGAKINDSAIFAMQALGSVYTDTHELPMDRFCTASMGVESQGVQDNYLDILDALLEKQTASSVEEYSVDLSSMIDAVANDVGENEEACLARMNAGLNVLLDSLNDRELPLINTLRFGRDDPVLNEITLEMTREVDSKGNTPLHYAATRGNVQLAQALLKANDALLNIKGHDSRSPLVMAATGGHDILVEHLLSLQNVEKNHFDIAFFYAIDALEQGNYDDSEITQYKNILVCLLSVIDMADLLEDCFGKDCVSSLENACKNFPLLVPLKEELLEILELKTPIISEIKHQEINVIMLPENEGVLTERDIYGNTPLHWAVKCGNFSLVKALVGKGLDVGQKNTEGMTPLHIAAAYGYEDITEYLISENSDVTAENNEALTPLHYARNTAVTTFLMRAHETEKLKFCFDTDDSPLFLAMQHGRVEVVRNMISHVPEVALHVDSSNATLLFRILNRVAVLFSKDLFMEDIVPSRFDDISRCISVQQAQDDAKITPEDYAEIVVQLVPLTNLTIDCFRVNEDESNPVKFAEATQLDSPRFEVVRAAFNAAVDAKMIANIDRLRRNDTEVELLKVTVAELVSTGNINQQDLDDALCYQAYSGRADNVQVLLEFGASPDFSNRDGVSLIHYVLIAMKDALKSSNKEDVCNLLDVILIFMRYIADIHIESQNGLTSKRLIEEMREIEGPLAETAVQSFYDAVYMRVPFIVAVKNQDENIFEMLNKDSVQESDLEKNTPLHYAARFGNVALAQGILNINPDLLDAQNIYGESPLLFAVFYAKSDMVAFLLREHANANVQNNDGFAPLHLAASERDVQAILSSLGGSVSNALSALAQGCTPLVVAAKNGKLKVVESLIAAGADVSAVFERKTAMQWVQAIKENMPLESTPTETPNGADQPIVQRAPPDDTYDQIIRLIQAAQQAALPAQAGNLEQSNSTDATESLSEAMNTSVVVARLEAILGGDRPARVAQINFQAVTPIVEVSNWQRFRVALALAFTSILWVPAVIVLGFLSVATAGRWDWPRRQLREAAEFIGAAWHEREIAQAAVAPVVDRYAPGTEPNGRVRTIAQAVQPDTAVEPVARPRSSSLL